MRYFWDLSVKNLKIVNNYILAVDGAYSSKFNQMGIGILFIKDDKEIIRYSNSYKGGTNNIAEMMALLVGLRMIKNPINSLTIYSDSMYVIGCLTKNWARKKITSRLMPFNMNKFNIIT